MSDYRRGEKPAVYAYVQQLEESIGRWKQRAEKAEDKLRGDGVGSDLSDDDRERLRSIAGYIERCVEEKGLHSDFGSRDARFLRKLAKDKEEG
jgi:hypothetical protein